MIDPTKTHRTRYYVTGERFLLGNYWRGVRAEA